MEVVRVFLTVFSAGSVFTAPPSTGLAVVAIGAEVGVEAGCFAPEEDGLKGYSGQYS